MRFFDEAKIYIESGHGGSGCTSFRREPHVPKGGPDGGDGGRGGDIILKATSSKKTLLDFKFKSQYKAKRGQHGQGANKSGSNGEDLILLVPVGTIIFDENKNLLCDLDENDKQFIAAYGGMGGKGNAFFKTSVNQAPRYSQNGIDGEIKTIFLELKLIADVGIIGFPNAGKSTLISVISNSRPKIADYPFTTLSPNLGVVQYDKLKSYTVADVPGLIEGASKGKGLGIKFLKHVERTKVLLHLIEVTDKNKDGIIKEENILAKEMQAFAEILLDKQRIIVLSKIDLVKERNELNKAKKYFEGKGMKCFMISSATREGVPELVNQVGWLLEKLESKLV